MESEQLGDFVARVHSLTSQLVRNHELCDRACLARYGVTASQGYTVLRLPHEGTLSMNELSKSMGVDNSTMTRMVDQLVQKGLVLRHLDDTDRRVVRVGLTPQGRELRGALGKALQDFFAGVLDEIREEERSAIVYALERVNRAMARGVEACCGCGQRTG